MSSDIVTQLRIQAEVVNGKDYHTISGGLHLDAADEIERLRADRDRWRKIADGLYLWLEPSLDDDSVYEAGEEAMTMYYEAVRGE